MVDNFSNIIQLMKFESSDDFYYLQILQRKKENSQLGSNSRVIKNYYIKSVDELVAKMDEIITLCDTFNARASFRINKRSFKKVAYKALCNVANTLHNGEYKHIAKAYDRACGKNHNESKETKRWILDIDDVSDYGAINQYLHTYHNDIYDDLHIIDSKNGLHIISPPFRLDKFKEQFPKISVHKDNPTNLYIP
jgi:hypothetical protein